MPASPARPPLNKPQRPHILKWRARGAAASGFQMAVLHPLTGRACQASILAAGLLLGGEGRFGFEVYRMLSKAPAVLARE